MIRTRRIGPHRYPRKTGTVWYWDAFSNPPRWYRNSVSDTGDYTGEVLEELCVDVVHQGPRNPYDTGGPLTVRKCRTVANPANVHDIEMVSGYSDRYYTGLIFPQEAYSVALPNAYTGSEFGAEAWRKAKPGKPGVDLAQAIAELKDVPGMVKRIRNDWKRTMSNYGEAPARYGNLYLTWMFGIAPVISDLKNLYETYKNQEIILAQLKRDNGKGIRRRKKLASVIRSTTTNFPTNFGAFYPQVPHEISSVQRVNTYKKDVWFSGRFRYYIPDIGTVEWERRAIRSLYGMVPKLALIWELTPWSWLVDYFASVGDVLDNLQDDLAENLVADYAYLMASQYETQKLVLTGNVFQRGTRRRIPITCSHTAVWETKSRSVASPFGFGLSVDNLSGRQQSILAALAATRLK